MKKTDTEAVIRLVLAAHSGLGPSANDLERFRMQTENPHPVQTIEVSIVGLSCGHSHLADREPWALGDRYYCSVPPCLLSGSTVTTIETRGVAPSAKDANTELKFLRELRRQLEAARWIFLYDQKMDSILKILDIMAINFPNGSKP